MMTRYDNRTPSNQTSGAPWTEKEKDTLRELYEDADYSLGEIQEAIPGRTRPAIHNRASILGVSRPGNGPATESPSLQRICWAAGFWEGDGSCQVSGANKDLLQVGITQIDRQPLDWMSKWFGGCVRSYNQTTAGNDVYQWRIYGARARGFLLTIYKFLTDTKKERVRGCLDKT